jgi:hypothetical protein
MILAHAPCPPPVVLMPRGTVPERPVACHACGTTFHTTKVGKAAFFCRTEECDKQRARERGEMTAQERAVRRDQLQQERAERAEHQKQEQITKVRDRIKKTALKRSQAIDSARELGHVITGLLDELAGLGVEIPTRAAPAVSPPFVPRDLQAIATLVAHRVKSLHWDDAIEPRAELRRRITKTANAAGREALQDALYELAAVAIGWARTLDRASAVRSVVDEAA